MASWGLSPRLRGNGFNLRNRIIRCGSIPALAGERPDSHNTTDGEEVYPRACGGTLPARHDVR